METKIHLSYEIMKILLYKTEYRRFQWQICGNFESCRPNTGFTVGVHEWNGIVGLKKNQCVKKQWSEKSNLTTGIRNVICESLINSEKVLPFHIKLGLMKNSVKATNKYSEDFLY